MNEVLYGTVFSSAQYLLSDYNKSYERDGKQQLEIGVIASRRLAILAGQWDILGRGFNTYHLHWVPLALGCLHSFAVPYAKKYLENDFSLKAVAAIDQAAVALLQHSDKIINLMCVTSYVAMIALGLPIAGGIGLAAVTLTILKRNGYLPHVVDRMLKPLLIAAWITSEILTPTSLFIRIMQVISFTSLVVKHLSNIKCIREKLPEMFTNPETGNFSVDPDRPKVTDDDLGSPCRFQVDLNSVHARELKDLIPVKYSQELKAMSTDDLMKNLEDRVELTDEGEIKEETGEKVLLDKTQSDGLRRLKEFLANHRVQDVTHNRFDEFELFIKAQVHSILQSEDFKGEIGEFLDILAEKCTDGWTRDLPYLLKVPGATLAWTVHHELSKLRGLMLNEIIKAEANEGGEIFFDAAGGDNGVHLLDAFHRMFWYRYRTIEGEKCVKLRGINLIEALKIHYLRPGERKPESVTQIAKEWYYIGSESAGAEMLPLGILPRIFHITVRLFKEMDRDYTLRKIEDYLLDQMLMKRVYTQPFIDWVNEKYPDRQDKYIKYDEFGMCLTRLGVRRLLYDLGIIKKV